MKRIINGKKYDTDTAELVCRRIENEFDIFSIIDEELYLKKTGEFFLYGYGGAMTDYRMSCGNGNWSGSSKIIPFTKGEAKRFVAEYGSVSTYERLFGEVEE